MDDQEFASRIQVKIERSTGQSIELRVDHQDTGQLQVEFNREVPLVVVGANVFQFSGVRSDVYRVRGGLHPGAAPH